MSTYSHLSFTHLPLIITHLHTLLPSHHLPISPFLPPSPSRAHFTPSTSPHPNPRHSTRFIFALTPTPFTLHRTILHPSAHAPPHIHLAHVLTLLPASPHLLFLLLSFFPFIIQPSLITSPAHNLACPLHPSPTPHLSLFTRTYPLPNAFFPHTSSTHICHTRSHPTRPTAHPQHYQFWRSK